MGKGTAKIKGTASKVGAALTGKVGVLATLEGEHTEVASMMDDVLDTKSVEKQRELYHEIRKNLLLHTQGEEQGLYAECRAHESTRNLAEKAIQDHMEVKRIISTLDSMTVGSPDWLQKFAALQSSVKTHVEFEEERLFPTVKDVLGVDALRDLDGRYKALRKQVEEHGEVLEPKAASGF
jgi:hemerythrin superfamily protein